MSAKFEEILTVYGHIGEQVLKDAVDKVSATNKTVESVRSQVIETNNGYRLQLIAREWFSLIEKGRGPTDKGPSPEMIEHLTEYARARGMDDPESAAWAIAKTINKKGDKTHRAGGRIVYSDELNKFVEEVITAIKKEFKTYYVSEIKKAFNGTNNS